MKKSKNDNYNNICSFTFSVDKKLYCPAYF